MTRQVSSRELTCPTFPGHHLAWRLTSWTLSSSPVNWNTPLRPLRFIIDLFVLRITLKQDHKTYFSKSRMATVAHCLYCFESLVADLEKREPLSLSQVQDWWDQYNSRGESVTHMGDKHDEENTDGIDLEEEDEEEGDPTLDEGESEEDESQLDVPAPSRSELLRLPSISRLQNSSPASASTSSTPSSLSTTSSSAALGDSSKSSSKTSFFSFSRRSHQSSPARKEKEHPLFVTWNTVSSRSGHKTLRGCIGTFDPIELSNGLKSYALTAYVFTTPPSPFLPFLTHFRFS